MGLSVWGLSVRGLIKGEVVIVGVTTRYYNE